MRRILSPVLCVLLLAGGVHGWAPNVSAQSPPVPANPPGGEKPVESPSLFDPANWPAKQPPFLLIVLRGQDEAEQEAAEAAARKIQCRTEAPWLSLDSQIDLRDPRFVANEPGTSGKWKMDQTLKLPVTGPVFLFGQLGAGDNFAASQDMKMASRSGVGCKLPLVPGTELQFRSGPEVTCSDPQHFQEKSQLFLEMQCKCGLLGLAGLDYVGSATPALTLAERDRLSQELRLTFPLGKIGQFQVGAKHSWENVPDSQPWTNRVQLQIGSDLKW